MLRQSEFAERTEHPVAFLAAQLALSNVLAARQVAVIQCNRHDIASLDVVCAGANLDWLPRADIHLADYQFFRIRMRVHRKQFTNNHIADFAAFNLITLHFRAGHGHLLRECAGGDMSNIHIIL